MSWMPYPVFWRAPSLAEASSSALLAPYEAWKYLIGAVLSTTTDHSVLDAIKTGYHSDDFCLCLAQNNISVACLINKLWYIRDHLIIPKTGDIHENLFCLTHDTLGHFSMDKSYANLQDAYYWPNMQTELEKAYVLSFPDCQ